MTPQEFFDKAVNGIRAQGGPSGEIVNIHSTCRPFKCLYRGPDGRKCAAGQHITDAEYNPRMEGKSVLGLVEKWLPIGHGLVVHPNLANDLQRAHDWPAQDTSSPSNFLSAFEDRVQRVARMSGLVYTPPSAQ